MGDQVETLLKRLADSVGARLRAQLPIETLMRMASVECAADLFTYDDIIDTSGNERKGPYARMSPGRAKALRM